MKKLIVIILVAGSVLVSVAQIPKGTILVGASSNLGFSNYKPDGGTSYTNLNLDVKGGYFVIENLAVGLDLGVSRLDQTNFTSTDANFGVFGKYYIIGKIPVGLGFGVVNSKTDSGPTTTKSNSSRINLNAGYAIFLGQSIALEPAVNINIDGGDSAGLGFGLAAGFTLFLNRK